MEILKATYEDLFGVISIANNEQDLSIDNLFSIARELELVETVPDRTVEQLFARTYLLYRRSLKHKGLVLITDARKKAWSLVTDVTKDALVFAKENDLEQDEAFLKYLDIAHIICNTLRLQEIRAKADAIHEYYLVENIVRDDDEPEFTEKIYNAYKGAVLQRTGEFDDFFYDPRQMIHMVEAKQVARGYRLGPAEFIKKAFEAYDWTHTVPKPHQLGGKYIAKVFKENEEKANGPKQVRRVNLKDIVKGRFRK